jgi:DHA2 family multidrug resistance protein
MQMVFIDVPEELHNDAAGIFNFFRNIASSIGTSLSATIVSHQMQTSWHDLASHVNPYARGYQWWQQSIPPAPEQMQVAMAQFKIMQQSSLISYLDSFYIFGFLLLAIIWLPFFLKKPPAGAAMGNMH